ncbi:MAG: phosphatidylserine/phosphatidylglycerophosphate/cardiolipin synthase family protein [Archangium sp.]|nr:phosphatidylserine/phosphatidylglycerophosphate/cardiolipin synthase family protein [Archangium sp.]MDP3575688.1 phosphatidylserine/phosphatidylglycerophosphate/cardiolipin synthase family protein [Archangium sp.]
MSGAHVVLVIDATAPAAPVFELARRFSPGFTHAHVVALDGERARPEVDRLLATLEAANLEFSIEESFDEAQVALAAHQHRGSLVVVGPWPSRPPRARALAVLQWVARYDVNVLAVSTRCAALEPENGLICVALDPGSSALAETAAAVRELPRVKKVAILMRGTLPDTAEPTLRALFPAHELELIAAGELEPAELAQGAHARHAELLVVPSADVSAGSLMSSIFSGQALNDTPLPVLILHHDAASTGLFAERLSATDTVQVPGLPLRLLVERSSALGRAALPEKETFFLVGAEQLGPLAHVDGVVQVPQAWLPPQASSFALSAAGSPTPVASAMVLRGKPLVLLDARFPVEALTDVEPFALEHTIVVVRLRADQPLETVRTRFDAAAPWGGPVPVLDASAFLADGGAGDVSELVDGVRLQRLALELLMRGAPVVSIITPSGPEPRSPAFSTWTASSLRARSPTMRLSSPPVLAPDDEARWRLRTQAPLVQGHRVTLELENSAARQALLASIADARERIHWQSYMVDDDAVSEEVADALRQAAARGVKVRVLVDALYSLHQAYFTRNPVLERLGAAPNVEVLASRPLSGLPQIVDLKQRNHRKLRCIDRRLATVSGRNLGAAYYRGFSELELTSATPFHEVPWLDAGVAFEGPLVEAVDRSFLADWLRAGGEPFEVSPSPPAGTMACRLVLHQGLEDAYTLDTQLELIRSAQKRLVMVNTFPLVLELQRALVAAVQRGVRVQCLFGSVLPRWGDDQPFGRGALRSLADELVRARMSPVLRAGAEGFQYMVAAAGLGPVFTHVHAKLLVRDEDTVAVGSANADVTSAYWESEAVLLVHDQGFARSALAALEPLMTSARPVDLRTPGWKELEARRAWLSRNWPTLFP